MKTPSYSVAGQKGRLFKTKWFGNDRMGIEFWVKDGTLSDLARIVMNDAASVHLYIIAVGGRPFIEGNEICALADD